MKKEYIFSSVGVILVAAAWALLLRSPANQTPNPINSPPVLTEKKPPDPPRDIPVKKVLDSVVIGDVSYSGEPMGDAIDQVTQHLQNYCAKKNILAITVEQAISTNTMSFSSTAMTANMLLKMIASEARMDLIIDTQNRSVRFTKRLQDKISQ